MTEILNPEFRESSSRTNENTLSAAAFLNAYFDEHGKPEVNFQPRGVIALGDIINQAGELARPEIISWYENRISEMEVRQ